MTCLACFGSGKYCEGVGVLMTRGESTRLVRCNRCKGTGIEKYDAPKEAHE